MKNSFLQTIENMVGASRFERPTSRPPGARSHDVFPPFFTLFEYVKRYFTLQIRQKYSSTLYKCLHIFYTVVYFACKQATSFNATASIEFVKSNSQLFPKWKGGENG